ncbi:MAG: class I SAM-dependent methyltransferase [Chloroflexi bacterium]|nr:class I SAM-dependent methyltransferase [Chloroflexota bacterium]
MSLLIQSKPIMNLLTRLRKIRTRPLQTLPSRSAYAQWAKTYPAEAHNLLMQVEQTALMELMPSLQQKFILDLGCGTGRWGKIALSRGAEVVIGLDNSLPMLRVGVLEWMAQAEMTDLPLQSSSVDVILCGLALGHLPHTKARQAVAEMGRVLKSGGVALISDFHPFQAWQGAQRTFTGDDGRTYAVEHTIHGYADYLDYSQAAGLQIDAILEPRHPKVQDGKTPLVLALRLRK